MFFELHSLFNVGFQTNSLGISNNFRKRSYIGHGVGTKFQGIKQCVKFTSKNTNCCIHSKTAYNSTENGC